MSADQPTTLPHLTVDQSERGFAYLPTIHDGRGGRADVYESSAAEEPCVWLKASNGQGTVHLHLDADTAWQVADQLRHAVRNHYQGDATPEWARKENQ